MGITIKTEHALQDALEYAASRHWDMLGGRTEHELDIDKFLGSIHSEPTLIRFVIANLILENIYHGWSIQKQLSFAAKRLTSQTYHSIRNKFLSRRIRKQKEKKGKV